MYFNEIKLVKDKNKSRNSITNLYMTFYVITYIQANGTFKKKNVKCVKMTENIRHLIFNCKNVQKICNVISDSVTFQV